MLWQKFEFYSCLMFMDSIHIPRYCFQAKGVLCWPWGGWGALHANYVQFIYKVSKNVPNGQK